MSHSQNTGCLKAKDTEVDTMKDQRAEQVVGLMLMLTKLASKHKGEKKKNSGISTTERIKEVKNPHLKAEIEKLTTLYDRWGKGKPQGIPESDLQGLLLAMGMHYSGRNLDKLVLEIDTNHDGFISLDDVRLHSCQLVCAVFTRFILVLIDFTYSTNLFALFFAFCSLFLPALFISSLNGALTRTVPKPTRRRRKRREKKEVVEKKEASSRR